MFRKLILLAILTAAAWSAPPLAAPAHACPMCKYANEEGSDEAGLRVANARPRAYMYSILFMLSMPATLVAAFGTAFYRLHKKQQALNAHLESTFVTAT